MKKQILSFTVIALFILYSFWDRKTSQTPEAILPISPPASTPNQNNTYLTPSISAIKSNKAFRDGEYIGNIADAYYGNIQVKAVIKNGVISDVQFLQYPNDRRNSIEINRQAMPILKQEAIQIQNSSVDIVTGATDTSLAFMESLKSALLQARSI